MRALRVVGIALIVATASVTPPASEAAVDGEGRVDASCTTACDAALETCRAQADAEVKRCRDDAYKPCDVWCPCDQFVGHAQLACLLECDKCEAQAERITARCPDGSAAKASCEAEHRRCRRDCAEGE